MLNGKIAQENVVKIDKVSGKLATALTPPELVEEKVFRELHSILHYVNTNNILGPIPEHPERDKNYEAFEEGIRKWAEENDYEIVEDLPTEYDDIHTEENKPDLDILEPRNNTHFSSPNLDVSVRVQTKRTMDKVEYYIDNQLISTQTRYPYNLNGYKLLGFSNGQRSLRVKAYDDVGNFREKSISIYLNLAEEYTRPVTWLSPADGDEVYGAEFPYNLKVRVNNYTLYNKADFYIKKSGGSSTWVDYMELSGNEAGALLLEAGAGDYDFYVILTGKDGQTLQDQGIRIKILE